MLKRKYFLWLRILYKYFGFEVFVKRCWWELILGWNEEFGVGWLFLGEIKEMFLIDCR